MIQKCVVYTPSSNSELRYLYTPTAIQKCVLRVQTRGTLVWLPSSSCEVTNLQRWKHGVSLPDGDGRATLRRVLGSGGAA